jgi:hypothetical protein
MQPSEALDIVAQVAVTLAGFAGIVVVFRPEALHQWSALDRFRLRLLLINSALPLVFALFAILLLSIDPAPTVIWRWCSGFSLVVDVAFLISGRSLSRSVSVPDLNVTTKMIYYSVSLVALLAFTLQVINLVRWNQFWPFFFGLFVHLVAAVVQFVRMIILSPARE